MFHVKHFLSTRFSTWLKTFQRVYQMLKTFFFSCWDNVENFPPLYLFFFSLHRRRHAAAADKAVKNQEVSAQIGYLFSLTSKQNKVADVTGLP